MRLSYKEFTDILGKNLGSLEAQALLKKISPRRSPSLKRTGELYERTAHFDLPKLGLMLHLELPTNNRAIPANEKYLKFTSVEFWQKDASMGMPRAFAGELPFDLRLSDDPETVLKKGGKPSSISATFNSKLYHWDNEKLTFRVVFGKRGPKSKFKISMLAYELD